MKDVWEMIIGEEPFIVAEIGKNFIQTEVDQTVAQYLENAKALVGEAVRVGASAVKFQTHVVEDEQYPVRVVSPHFKGLDRYNWVKRNEAGTPLSFWQELKSHCDRLGILFFSTPMSRGAAEKLVEVEVPLWKVGSGDILDFVLLDYLRQRPEPIIISAGMSTVVELDKALAFIREKHDKVALLHCISKYPCDAKDLNIATMNWLRDKYDLPTGFSDHSIGIDSVLVAIEEGAKIIEKHFSKSRDLWGSDHQVSMLPEELMELTRRVKAGDLKVEDKGKYLGEAPRDDFEDAKSEFRPLFRKSLVFSRDMKAGEEIKPEDVMAMRPQEYLGGVHSEDYVDIVGRKMVVDKGKDEVVSKYMVEARREKVR